MSATPLAALLSLAFASPALGGSTPTALSERRELLMLTALACVHANASASPKPGADIGALVAWNVEDLAKMPEFVLDVNRNAQDQSRIRHAETVALDLAYAFKKRAGAPPERRLTELDDATLFTTLESCPMCAATMLVARVPRAVYCMEDPTLRDPATRKRTVPSLDRYQDRSLEQEPSSLSLCGDAERRMWEAAAGKTLDIVPYLAGRDADLFAPAARELEARSASPANAELLVRLRAAAGRCRNSLLVQDLTPSSRRRRK